MNNYERKQAARRARYEARGEAAASASASAYNQAHTMAQAIPFGQPILVGHHSEKRDRAYRGKIHSKFGQAFALAGKAEHYEQKAAAVGTGGISSDDPEAILKLRDELVALDEVHTKMKRANYAIKREARAELADMGFTAGQIEELFKPDFAGRVGFASYSLSNNRANARRIAERIRELEARADMIDVRHEGQGYVYREDLAENRVMFEFPGKPEAATRDLLKRHAFKWSPTRGVWVRQLTSAGRYAGKQMREALDAATS
jgi:hypothetical protein